MQRSTDRILTTHVGSLPRPERLREMLTRRRDGHPVDEAELAQQVHDAIFEVVRQQADAGIDVVSDGEMGKTQFFGYAEQRLTGLTPASPTGAGATAGDLDQYWARRIETREEWRAFRSYYAQYLPVAMPPHGPVTNCTGPVSYAGQALLERDLVSLRAALGAANVQEAFVPAIAPGMITSRYKNEYYPSEAEYLAAVSDALRTEYRAIVDTGFILQIDDPGLGETWGLLGATPNLEEYRRYQAANIEALNGALDGIPEDRVRFHLCWGSWQGPHTLDLSLGDIVDLMLRVNAGAYSFEAATPRHSWEWRIWNDVTLPEHKVLVPGVIAHTTAVVEHPETVAERIQNFAGIVGRERVIAGADCGFAQGFGYERQHPSVMWAKFEALAEGAALASTRLWGR